MTPRSQRWFIKDGYQCLSRLNHSEGPKAVPKAVIFTPAPILLPQRARLHLGLQIFMDMSAGMYIEACSDDMHIHMWTALVHTRPMFTFPKYRRACTYRPAPLNVHAHAHRHAPMRTPACATPACAAHRVNTHTHAGTPTFAHTRAPSKSPFLSLLSHQFLGANPTPRPAAVACLFQVPSSLNSQRLLGVAWYACTLSDAIRRHSSQCSNTQTGHLPAKSFHAVQPAYTVSHALAQLLGGTSSRNDSKDRLQTVAEGACRNDHSAYALWLIRLLLD